MADLVSGLLRRVGITPENAAAALSVAIGEAKDVAGDLAGTAAIGVLQAKISAVIRPMLLEVRTRLLAAIGEDPPEGFIVRLRLRGYTDATDDQIKVLWSDMIAALAELRIVAPIADLPELRTPCTKCGQLTLSEPHDNCSPAIG